MTPLTSVNTSDHEYAPRLLRQRLAYTSQPSEGSRQARAALLVAPVLHGDLAAGPTSVPHLGTPHPLSPELTSELHESVLAATPDEDLLVFARNGGEKRRQRTNRLYASLRGSLDYQVPRALPFSSGEANDLHPSLCPLGYRMIFASDRAGGHGGFDLYYAERTESGWGPATNLGPNVNTAADEVFPFWGEGDVIAFSSNRAGGLGLLDVYVLQAGGTTWPAPSFLPAPINSPGNDHGLSFSRSEGIALLASDRAGGRGGDDLYALNAAGLAYLTGAIPEASGAMHAPQQDAFGLYPRTNSPASPGAPLADSSALIVVDDLLGAPLAGVRVETVEGNLLGVSDSRGRVRVATAAAGGEPLILTRVGLAPKQYSREGAGEQGIVSMDLNEVPDSLSLTGNFRTRRAALSTLPDHMSTTIAELSAKIAGRYVVAQAQVSVVAGLSPKLRARLVAECERVITSYVPNVRMVASGTPESVIGADVSLRVRLDLRRAAAAD